MKKTNRTQQRRLALKKISLGSVLTGAVALNSGQWLKPVVQTVMLPAHASTTDVPDVPDVSCYDVSVLVFDFVFDPVGSGGGNGSFKIELSSTAPDLANQVMVSNSSVSSGVLTTPNTGGLYVGSSLVFGWVGTVIPTTPVPMDPLNSGGPVFLSIEWVCATGESGVLEVNLTELVIAEEANW